MFRTIFLSDIFGSLVPDYSYYLFRLQDCDDNELIGKKDEISLIMLINKLRKISDIEKLKFPNKYLEEIANNTTGDVLIILSRLIESYLRNINLPDEQIYELTDRIKEGDMNRLFEHFEKFDIQEYRREAVLEGEAYGHDLLLINLVHKKLERGKTADVIAEEIEEPVELVNEIIDVIHSLDGDDSGEFEASKILEAWKKEALV